MQYFTKGVSDSVDETGSKKKKKAITKSGEPKAQKVPAPLKTNNMGQHDNKLKQPGSQSDQSPEAGSSSDEDGSLTKENPGG